MTGSEGYESPLEQVTGEKDVTPEEEHGGDRAQEHDTRREERDGTPGSTSGDTAGDASGDASGDGEPDAGS
ncbi:hypothetical protein [Streptomyces sudanensis]|uniref:hypothetical protein n=1 Tax=Streptomyces sudanensis TaxID=436397 RepID=UPI0020CE9A37|nr:hypothetical protein [Streptomyces sudanensis]MCP9956429.1 hypothetical protein [Streptomyces sudanensis]MCQ0002959.1 hypothetical protein [Streptomyces sudanensis]